MAGDAVIGDAGMVKHRWDKGAAGDVTNTAILIRWNVTCMLAGRTACTAIMTGVAPFAHNVGSAMVDKCTEEISRVMAGTAIFIGDLMNRRIRRPSGSSCNIICTSIVARNTITRDVRMRKNIRYE